MRIKELRNKKEPELRKMLAEIREKLRVFRFDLAAGKVKDVRAIRQSKKDIAKILTILNPVGDSSPSKVKEKKI